MVINLILLDLYYFIISIFILLTFSIYYGLSRSYYLHTIHKQLICGISIFFSYYLVLVYITKYNIQLFFFDTIVSNVVTVNLHFIVVLSSLFVVLVSYGFVNNAKAYSFEFYLLFISIVFGLILLISFVDFIGIYLSIELISMCFYLLTTFSKYNVYSNEAALKYFILGTISSNFILFGFSFIYVGTGLTNLIEISKVVTGYVSDVFYNLYPLESNMLLLYLSFGFFFIFGGILFKMYAAPFHTWIPDIYQAAPLIVTMLFGILPLLPFVNLVLRFVLIVSMVSPIWSYFFLFFAVNSIVLGTLFSLFQTRIRRLLAYSAVTHVGYFFIFIYLFTSTVGIGAYLLQLLFMYIYIYIFTNIGIFSILSSLFVIKKHHSLFIEDLYDFSRLFKSNSILSFSLVIFFFSMAGLPPLPGFIGKLFLFTSIFYSGNKIFLFILILLMAVLSGFYYLRLIKIIYFNTKYSINWVYCSNVNYLVSVIVPIILMLLFHLYLFPEVLSVPSMNLALGYLS